MTHTYTAPVGTPFTATISVTDSDGDVHTDTFKVRVEPNTLDTQANMAIDKGLWYNHKTMVISDEATLLAPAVPNFFHPANSGNTVVDQVSPNLYVYRDSSQGLKTPTGTTITAFTPGVAGAPVSAYQAPYAYNFTDVISPSVQLTRGGGGGLYNTAGGSVLWANGSCASATGASFGFQDNFNGFRQTYFRGVNSGNTVCMADVTAGVAYDLTFTNWSSRTGEFGYTRQQAATFTTSSPDVAQWAVGTCAAPVTPFYNNHTDTLYNYFRFRPETGNLRNWQSMPNVPQCLRDVTTGVDYDFTVTSWGSGNTGNRGEFAYIREGLPGGSLAVYGPPTGVGKWTDTESMAAVPAALQAFEVNGHRETGNPLTNPYVDDVARGLKFLQGQLKRIAIDAQGHAGTPADPSPDTNGNGYGLDSPYGEPVYVIGQIVDAFVASGTPSATAVLGTENGRTYLDIVQDLMDSYSYGQNDNPGGWVYRWNDGGIDSSSSGWWGVGKHAADVWGVVTPQWVMDNNKNMGIPQLQGGNGACGYRDPGVAWSQMAETAACMIMLSADGVARTDAQFAAVENWMAGAFATTNSSYPGGIDPFSSIYNMYNVAKSMRTAIDSSGNATPIALMGGTVDWYGASNGMARNLIDNQRADGKLATQNGVSVNDGLSNSWGILILSPALFEQGPTAACSVDSSIVCQAGAVGGCNATNTNPYATANFDGSASSAGDNPIAGYAWNFQDGGSTVDATTVAASTSFSTLGTFNVQLTVTDTAGHSSSVTCPVQVTDSALPPVSDPGGPYEICEGRGSVVLNGAGSVGRGATIVSYEWDFTGAITFTPVDATGVSTDQTAYFHSLAPGTYDVGLRVSDDSLSHFVTTNYTTVTVKAATHPDCAHVDEPPTADSQHVVTQEDTPIGITLTGVDPDGNAVTYTVTGGPSFGSLSGTGPNLTYTPNLNYVGPDAFTFTVNDGALTSAPATVTIDVTPVNDPPVANPDAKVTPEDTPVGGVVTSSDVDGGAPTYSLATGASNGTVVVNASGAYTYTPNTNYNGGDSFTYTVVDGNGGSATSTVTITVLPVNDAPVAVNDAYTGQWNTLLTVPVNGVLGNDSDVDGNALTSIKLTNPASGAIVLNLNGSLTYMPAANFAGVATFTYKANDGALDSNVATVSITITSPCPSKSRDGKSRDGHSNYSGRGSDDKSDDGSSDDKSSDCRPGTPASHSDHYTTKKNSPLTVALNKGVLKNDGALAVTAELIAGANHGTVVLAANGTFLYTPAANFVGNDAFYYVARSSAGVAGRVVKVSIRVRGHWDGDGCDHDKKKKGHKKGDGDAHDRDHD